MKTKLTFSLPLTVAAFLAFSLSACETAEPAEENPSCNLATDYSHPKTGDYLELIDLYNQAGVPGFGLSVLSPEGWWTGTGGMSDLENGFELQPCHVFRIGSASKVFAATLALMLFEDGLIDLDERADTYVRKGIMDHIPNGHDVTVRQLLNHTSGIPECLNPKSYMEIVNLSQDRITAEEALEYIYDAKPLAPAGEKGGESSYSNSNYLLLGLVIRNVSGAPNAYEVMKERIIEPLQLENTYVGTEIPSNMTRGYYEYYGHLKDLTDVDHAAVGGMDRLDGGIISSSRDMVRFMSALTSGELVSTETLEMMMDSNPVDVGGLDHITGYGLGLMRIETEYGTGYGHYGSVHCFHSAMFHFPESALTVAYTLNGGGKNQHEMNYSAESFNLVLRPNEFKSWK